MAKYLILLFCLCAPIKAPVISTSSNCNTIIFITKKVAESELLIDTACSLAISRGFYQVFKKDSAILYPMD